jgi:UDP-N-acetylglucosamine transferase subunit ALG13
MVFVRLLFGFIPIKKTYDVISHAIISGTIYEIALEDKTLILISADKLYKVIIDKKYQTEKK